MNVYDSSWIVDAPPRAIWEIFHPPKTFDRSRTTVDNPRVIGHGILRVAIVSEGDEKGVGLVRVTRYRAPWYVGGIGRSWEIISEIREYEFERYDVLLCFPPRAKVKGWYRLEDLGDGRTRLHVHEEFSMESRWLAPLLERRVHDFILKESDHMFRAVIAEGLRAQEAARSA